MGVWLVFTRYHLTRFVDIPTNSGRLYMSKQANKVPVSPQTNFYVSHQEKDCMKSTQYSHLFSALGFARKEIPPWIYLGVGIYLSTVCTCTVLALITSRTMDEYINTAIFNVEA